LVTAIVSLENVKKIVKEFYGIDKIRNNYDLLTPSKYGGGIANRMGEKRSEYENDDDKELAPYKKRHRNDDDLHPDTYDKKIGSTLMARKMDDLRKKSK
jgi:hypothetical protein